LAQVLGFNIFSRTNNDDFDNSFNKKIQDFSKKGLHKGEYRSLCEITDSYTFAEAQRQMVDEYMVKSGGFLIAHHFSDNFKYGYKFEILPLYLIDTGKTVDNENVKNGLKFNKKKQITGIYILQERGDSVLVSYKRLTLVINKWADIQQRHGVSPFKRVIEALEYIDNYKAKEMDGAGRRAETPMIIKTPRFNEIFNAVKAKILKVAGGKVAEEDLIKQYFDLRRLDKNNPTGKFDYIADDEEVVETGKGVFTIYKDMWNNEMQSASSAIGLSSYSTAGIMPSSYNQALRAAQDEEEEFKIAAQEIEVVLREIVEYRLLFGCIMKDLLPISKTEFFANPDKYMQVEFIRREKGHIDPIKTEKAITESVTVNKTKSMQRALKEKGIDPQRHLEELDKWEMEMLEMKKKYKKLYEDAGLIYDDKQHESVITDEDLIDE